MVVGGSKIQTLEAMVLKAHEDAMAKLQSYLPPSRREAVTAQLYAFAARRPLLASLVAAQVAFSGIPLVVFVLFALGTLLFSFTAALAISVLFALIFAAVCVGFASLVLVPLVMGTTVLGLTAWCWAWLGWYLLRWFGVLGRAEGVRGKPKVEEEKKVQDPLDGLNGHEGETAPSG
jgi:Promethin